MTRNSGTPGPTPDDRDPRPAGTTGDAAVEGGKSAGERDRLETSPVDDSSAIDLDTAHDRAS
jgi:hypothetical protein